MFANLVASLMIGSLLTAQTPVAEAPAAPPDQNAPATAGQSAPAMTGENSLATAGQNPSAPAARAITLPTGTSIALTLMSTVKSKSTKPGDSVRAVVAFPVTQGTQLAIPAGTYVEGVVNKVTAKPLSNQQPTFSVHFNRLVFANGYSVPLSGENTQALLLLPQEPSAPANEVAELTPLRLPDGRFAMGAGQQTTLPPLPPLPQNGPNPAVIGGAMAGGAAAIIIGMLVWAHHRANSYDYAVFDVGWQFQMVLDSPVTLDAAQVAAAMAAPVGN